MSEGYEPTILIYCKANQAATASAGQIVPGKRYRVECDDVGVTYAIDGMEYETMLTFTVCNLVPIA